MGKKGVFTLVSFILTIALIVTGISIIMGVMLPATERARASGVLDDAIQQLKILDSLITQVASESIGAQRVFDLKVTEGEFLIDNKTGTFRFAYETKYLPQFRGIVKEIGNLILRGAAPNVTCSLRFGNCKEDENCIFSLYKENNSHAGNCSIYDYKVCCKNLESKLKEKCTKAETRAFSLYKLNNSHSSYKRILNMSICITPEAICSLKSSCLKDEVCIASFYKDENSHSAKCGYYKNQLCCDWVVKEMVEGMLSYKDVKLVGEGVFPRGEYSLCIEKIGDKNISKVRIGIC